MASHGFAHRISWRSSRRPAVWAAAVALAAASMVTFASPANMAVARPNPLDADVSVVESADPVTAGTSYTYTVTAVPGASGEGGLTMTLSGAAATITAFTYVSDSAFCYTASATNVTCINTFSDTTVTLTVMPTAAGTVTVDVVLGNSLDFVTASESTMITPAGPTYSFTGFSQPVDNPPMVNTMKAGAAVPVKFGLGGDQGMDIFAAGYPASQQYSCSTGDPLDAIEVTVTAGGSSLSYDATTDTYTYVWKTDKAWKNQCRKLLLNLTDGSSHEAHFQFS
jgi:hypothetical protein